MSSFVRGQTVGGWRLEAFIAQGGQGEVWLGSRRDHAPAILKIGGADDEVRARMEREAKLGKRLQHRRIAKVQQSGTEGDSPFLVMEVVRGVDLGEVLLLEGPLPPCALRELAVAVLDGLRYLHVQKDLGDRFVLHRDLKPGNVLLGTDGAVKLADLGIALAASTGAQHVQSTVIRGTPVYFAPEQALGRPLDARSDLFAAGLLLFEAATRRRANNASGGSGQEVYVAALAALGTAEAWGHRLDVLTAELEEVEGELPGFSAAVLGLLAWDPDHRPPSADAALDLFAALPAPAGAGLAEIVGGMVEQDPSAWIKRYDQLRQQPSTVVAAAPTPEAASSDEEVSKQTTQDGAEGASAPGAGESEEGAAPVPTTQKLPRKAAGTPESAVPIVDRSRSLRGALQMLLAVAAVLVILWLWMDRRPSDETSSTDDSEILDPPAPLVDEATSEEVPEDQNDGESRGTTAGETPMPDGAGDGETRGAVEGETPAVEDIGASEKSPDPRSVETAEEASEPPLFAFVEVGGPGGRWDLMKEPMTVRAVRAVGRDAAGSPSQPALGLDAAAAAAVASAVGERTRRDCTVPAKSLLDGALRDGAIARPTHPEWTSTCEMAVSVASADCGAWQLFGPPPRTWSAPVEGAGLGFRVACRAL